MEMIKSIKKKITIDNGARIIKKFWVQQESSNFKNDNRIFLAHYQLRETIKLITRKSIYIQSNKELDYEFIEVLNQLWTRGINIYILTNKLYNSYKDTIVGKALIRYSNSISGDLVLIDGNTTVAKGYISDSDDFHKEKQYFTLNRVQIEECFEMFVYKFWKRTDFECIDKETFISPIETQEAPFDIFPKLNSKSIICDEYLSGNIINKLDSIITNAKRSITLIIGELNIENTLLEKIADRQDDNIKIEIITSINKGLQGVAPVFYPAEAYDIYGTENNIFSMIIVDDSEVVIFTGEIKNESLLNSFCIASEETDIIDKVLSYRNELVQNDKTYLYNSEEKLKEISKNKVILDINNISSSVSLIKEMEEVHGEAEVCESLTDLYNEVSHKSIDCSNKYSKVINYSYDLLPKYRDKSFGKDKIYDMWKDTYDNITAYSEELENDIKFVVNENSGLLSNIISFFSKEKVNSNNTLKELNYMQKDLENRGYSIDKLKEFDGIIKKSYDDYIKLNSDIENLKEYNEQLEKWKNRKKDIEDNIKKLEMNFCEKEQEIATIKADLSNNIIVEYEEIIISKEIELMEIKENIINESITLKIYFENMENINNFKNYINSVKNIKKKKDIDKIVDKVKEAVNDLLKDEQYYDNNYKNKVNGVKNPAALTALIKNIIINDLNEFVIKDLTEIDKIGLETLDNLKNELDRLNENLKEEKSKTNTNDLNKKLTVLQKELQNLESSNEKFNNQLEQLGKEFVYKPLNKEARGLRVKRYEVKLINEELPKVGVLYNGKNTRQLAIKEWKELESGIEEAERLNAELVCEITM